MLQILGVGGKESELDSIYKVRHKKKENGKLPFREVSINSRKIHTKKKKYSAQDMEFAQTCKSQFSELLPLHVKEKFQPQKKW